MVKLFETDIKTKEVIKWKGLHVLHFQGSSCSQKLRIFLKEKNISWKSHHINLVKGDNFSDWFLGINPRGVVPVLIDEGEVHIESNDIIKYLDEKFPTNSLWPKEQKEKIEKFLTEENEIHLDLRNLTMKFVAPTFLMKKKEKDIENFKKASSLIENKRDLGKDAQVNYHEKFIKNNGVLSESVTSSIEVFKNKLKAIENELVKNKYIICDELTIVDIAWFIYLRRLETMGFRFEMEYPNLNKWFMKLKKNKNFYNETLLPLPLTIISSIYKFYLSFTGESLKKYLDKK